MAGWGWGGRGGENQQGRGWGRGRAGVGGETERESDETDGKGPTQTNVSTNQSENWSDLQDLRSRIARTRQFVSAVLRSGLCRIIKASTCFMRTLW